MKIFCLFQRKEIFEYIDTEVTIKVGLRKWQEYLFLQIAFPPKWDNASCIPPTLAGETAVFPCMAVFNGETYSTFRKSVFSVIFEMVFI